MKTCNMCKHYIQGTTDWIWYEEYDQSLEVDYIECSLNKQEILMDDKPDDFNIQVATETWLAFAEYCTSFEQG